MGILLRLEFPSDHRRSLGDHRKKCPAIRGNQIFHGEHQLCDSAIEPDRITELTDFCMARFHMIAAMTSQRTGWKTTFKHSVKNTQEKKTLKNTFVLKNTRKGDHYVKTLIELH